MRVPHVHTILDSLKNPDDDGLEDDEVLDDFISFVNFAIGGHPRLLRAFVSILSEAGYLLLQRDEEGKSTEVAGQAEELGEQAMDIEEEIGEQGGDTREEVEGYAEAHGEDAGEEDEEHGTSEGGPQERSERSSLTQDFKIPRRRSEFTESDKEDLGPPFYIEVYDIFFDRHLYADINRRWRLLKDTWKKVQLKQFPEVSLGVLQSDGTIYLSYNTSLLNKNILQTQEGHGVL